MSNSYISNALVMTALVPSNSGVLSEWNYETDKTVIA